VPSLTVTEIARITQTDPFVVRMRAIMRDAFDYSTGEVNLTIEEFNLLWELDQLESSSECRLAERS
jgi:hypothetical protein